MYTCVYIYIYIYTTYINDAPNYFFLVGDQANHDGQVMRWHQKFGDSPPLGGFNNGQLDC